MGSRAVLLVCRSAAAAAAARLAAPPGRSACRPRRHLDQDRTAVLRRLPAQPLAGRDADRFLRAAAEKAGFFDELGHVLAAPGRRTVPWNVKAARCCAISTLRRRRRPGVAARRGLGPGAGLRPGPARGRRPAAADPGPAGQRGGVHRRLPALLLATDGLAGVRVAPFQLLASEGASTTTGRTCGTSAWPTGSPPPSRT